MPPQDRSPQDRYRQDANDRSKSKIPWQVWAALAGVFVAIPVGAKIFRVLHPLPNPSPSSSAIPTPSISPRDTPVRSSNPIPTPDPVDALAGVWEQYAIDPQGKPRYLSKGLLSKQNGKYIITIQNQAKSPDITNSLAAFDVEYNGTTWKFKSNWGYAIATFKLERISDTVFEGFSSINGQPLQKNRFVKVE